MPLGLRLASRVERLPLPLRFVVLGLVLGLGFGLRAVASLCCC